MTRKSNQPAPPRPTPFVFQAFKGVFLKKKHIAVLTTDLQGCLDACLATPACEGAYLAYGTFGTQKCTLLDGGVGGYTAAKQTGSSYVKVCHAACRARNHRKVNQR